MKRVLCSFHTEDTPSMVIYPDGRYKCFGCGAYGKGDAQYTPVVKEKEDIVESIAYIESLPKKEIRGLELPYDGEYYYVLWSNRKYYKKRSISESKAKYLSPIGHTKPLYTCNTPNNKNTIVIVEGEINAISLCNTLSDNSYHLVSPGSSTDFCRSVYIDYYTKFDSAVIIVDKDPSGVRFGLELKFKLKSLGMNVTLYLIEEDFNDLLTKYGKEKVKEEFNKALGVLKLSSRHILRSTLRGSNAKT